MLIQRFRRCSTHVKIVFLVLFCAFYVFMVLHYGLVIKNSRHTMLKLKYCYHKCIKKFSGYNKFHSVTDILFLLYGVTIIML